MCDLQPASSLDYVHAILYEYNYDFWQKAFSHRFLSEVNDSTELNDEEDEHVSAGERPSGD